MKRILLAGFGGQGVLFAGKFLSYIGLYGGMQVSWLPSYGPEMRGGTANCSVILSEERIGSPIVTNPNVLICMNLPSLDRFEKDVEPGGKVFLDSSLIHRSVSRTDIESYAIAATAMASEREMTQLSNMILIGLVMKKTGICDPNTAKQVLSKIIPKGREALIQANMKAIALGYEGDTDSSCAEISGASLLKGE